MINSQKHEYSSKPSASSAYKQKNAETERTVLEERTKIIFIYHAELDKRQHNNLISALRNSFKEKFSGVDPDPYNPSEICAKLYISKELQIRDCLDFRQATQPIVLELKVPPGFYEKIGFSSYQQPSGLLWIMEGVKNINISLGETHIFESEEVSIGRRITANITHKVER